MAKKKISRDLHFSFSAYHSIILLIIILIAQWGYGSLFPHSECTYIDAIFSFALVIYLLMIFFISLLTLDSYKSFPPSRKGHLLHLIFSPYYYIYTDPNPKWSKSKKNKYKSVVSKFIGSHVIFLLTLLVLWIYFMFPHPFCPAKLFSP